MLEVEPTGSSGRTASEAFARWLHHRYAPTELLAVGNIVLPLD